MWLCNYNQLWLFGVCANVAIQSSGKVQIPHLIWSSLEERILFTNGVIFRLQSSVHRGTNHELSWKKPPPNTVKSNVDCAFFNNNSIMGYGICFRDHIGHFMHGESSWKQCYIPTIEAEATTLLASIPISPCSWLSSCFVWNWL
jgi:hypothetical protein